MDTWTVGKIKMSTMLCKNYNLTIRKTIKLNNYKHPISKKLSCNYRHPKLSCNNYRHPISKKLSNVPYDQLLSNMSACALHTQHPHNALFFWAYFDKITSRKPWDNSFHFREWCDTICRSARSSCCNLNASTLACEYVWKKFCILYAN